MRASTDDLDDRDYWLSKSPILKLEHMEMLRTWHYGYLASSRLLRLFKLLNSHKVYYLLKSGLATLGVACDFNGKTA